MYNALMSIDKHKKYAAITLRKSGKSYNDIVKALGLKSKGTLSLWFKDLKLTDRSKRLLEKNNIVAHKRGLFNANRNRKNRILAENSEARKAGISKIGMISLKELMLIGTALYWAEGMKSERTAPSLSFSNSDPRLIAVYLRFVREVLRIPDERIRAGVHIYPSIDRGDAVRYWSSIMNLPQNRFYLVTQVSKASFSKRPKNILQFGTAVIKVNNRVQFHKVKGMIDGLASMALK